MSYAGLLINTMTTRRYAPGAIDSYGNPTKAWNDYLLAQPCRLTTPTGVEIKVGEEIVVADFELFTEDLDITEQDRVVVNGVTYEIILMKRRQDGVGNHHREIFLRTVR